MAKLPFVVIPAPLGTITTGNEISAKPAAHLKEFLDIGMTWKSSGNTNLWVRGDFGSAMPVDFVSLLAANALPGTTIRVRLGDTQGAVDGGGMLSNPYAFDNAAWSKTNCTVSADSIAAPDGTNTADTIQRTATGNHFVSQGATYSGTASKTFTFSVWLKAGTLSGNIILRLRDGASAEYGSLSVTPTSTWTRYSVTATFPGGAANNLIVIIDPAIDIGSAGETFYAWGAELVEADSSSYDSLPQPFVSPSITSDDGLYHSHHEIPSLQTKRWWRIDIGGHTGDFEAANLILGQRVTPSRYYSAGFEFGIQDQGSIDFGRWGVAEITTGIIMRTLKFELGWLAEAEEMTMFAPLMKKLGTRNPALWCFDPEATTYRQAKTYFGVVKENPFSVGGKVKPGTFSREFSILSLI